MKKTTIDQLAAAVVDELTAWTEEATEELKADVKETGKTVVKTLLNTSPKNTGEYAKGWRAKTVFENAEDIRVVVYNAKKPHLVHLLEHGRAGKGGTAKGATAPRPHVGPAEQLAERELGKKVKVKLG